MKVIVSGSTGLIGGAVLLRLIAVPAVTSVIALSRRDVGMSDPKLTTVIVKDFKKYSESELAQFAGAEACIWCLGSPRDGMDVHDGLTMAAADALLGSVVPKLEEGKKFRFVYTSGFVVERNQEKTLLIAGGLRKARGRIETKVLKLQEEHPKSWESFIVRPAGVTKGDSMLRFVAPMFLVRTDDLAAAMVDTAVNGGKQILENHDLKEKGRAVLGKK